MRKSSRFAALALTAALALGVATPALAAEGDSATTVNSEVKKELTTNAGSTVSETFSFTATAVTPTESDAAAPSSEAPNATVAPITLSAAASETSTTGTGAITFKSGDKEGAAAFPHAGIYGYTIRETSGNTSGMTYDDSTVYTIFVYVVNGNDGLEISGITAVKSYTTVVPADNTNKVSELKFENSYYELSDLVVSKTVTGNSANLTKQFEFEVTFTDPATTPSTVTIVGAKGTETVAVTDGKATFTLANGESVKFTGLVVGTTYTVKETGVSGYKTKAEGKSGSTSFTVAEGSDGAGLNDTTGRLIYEGDNANEYKVTNAMDDITVTGLILDNAPFLILGATAVAGIVLYGAAKRKLTA